MERKNANKEKPYWRKLGGGTLRLPGRIIKPNQRFYADYDELPRSAMDTVELLNGEAARPETPAPPPRETGYLVQPVEDTNGWFEVVNAEGKRLNEKNLRKKDADALKETLEG